MKSTTMISELVGCHFSSLTLLALSLISAGCTGEAQLAEERQAGQAAYDAGVSQFEAGNFEQAEQSFRDALSGILEPDLLFPAARYHALSLAHTGRIDEALGVLAEYEQGASGEDAYIVARAEAYAAAGQSDLAKDEYAAARELNPRIVVPNEYR